jgi:hypothetical protein
MMEPSRSSPVVREVTQPTEAQMLSEGFKALADVTRLRLISLVAAHESNGPNSAWSSMVTVCWKQDCAEQMASARRRRAMASSSTDRSEYLVDELCLLRLAEPQHVLPVRHTVGERVRAVLIKVDIELGQ